MNTLKIATWNVNGLRQRVEQLGAWVRANEPDVVCLQETKVVDEDFPHAEIEAMGFPHRLVHGQKTYNGVAILSKHPLEDPLCGFDVARIGGEPDPQARIVRATVRGIRVFGCYVPNGSPLGSEKYAYKIAWLRRLRADLEASCDPAGDVLLCGDLNIAPGDADVYDPFEAEGLVLFSRPERDALEQLMAWGLVDAWRQKNPFGSAFTWWDYRGSAFRNNLGFRIDHILVTRSLMRRVRSVTIDRTPRGWERPSDHAPVIATILEPGGA